MNGLWSFIFECVCHGLRTPNEAFFHWNPDLLGLGRQIGQINSGAFGVLLAELSAPILVVSSLSMFSIIQPLFLHKTEPLYPQSTSQLFIWDWDWNLSRNEIKSVNLQYNTMGRWAKRLGDQASDVPSIIFFFILSCKILCKNRFNFFL